VLGGAFKKEGLSLEQSLIARSNEYHNQEQRRGASGAELRPFTYEETKRILFKYFIDQKFPNEGLDRTIAECKEQIRKLLIIIFEE
jgi:hypothetical protein